jgi:hypothetical protein
VRRSLRIAVATAGCLISLLALLAWGAYWALQQPPDFYRQALASERARLAEAGDQLERQMLQLHNDARRAGRWRAVLSAEQINGWLAVDLPQKFPALLPARLREPRVEITPHRIRVAGRYEHDKFSAVVSADVEAHLTKTPNVVAVCVRKARAGAVPIPLKGLLESLRASAQRAELTLQWAQHEGCPAALITVPSQQAGDPPRTLQLEAVELGPGQIILAGRTSDGKPLQRLARPPLHGADQGAANHTRHR